MKKLHENQFQYISGAYIHGVSKDQCRRMAEEEIRHELSKIFGNLAIRKGKTLHDTQMTLTTEDMNMLQRKHGESLMQLYLRSELAKRLC